MNTFLEDILAQPETLHTVLVYTLNEGYPALTQAAQMIRQWR